MNKSPAVLSRRASGILLHPTSLSGPHGNGDLGPSAHRFLDFLAAAGQSWWQMLPVGPVGPSYSPYQSPSTFAGSLLLISLDDLVRRGWLADADLAGAGDLPAGRVDYPRAAAFRENALRRAFERFSADPSGELRDRFDGFGRAARGWLDDVALFQALKRAHGGVAWWDWEADLRTRKSSALAAARRAQADEIRFRRFVQFCFAEQWTALRAATAERGIGLIGDVPIFVADDSADVWANPDVFHLDDRGRPSVQAGVPPDIFSKTGQLWGNPLYRWDALRKDGYGWWIERLRGAFARFDAVRLDHFIGFHRCWEVPGDAKNAIEGRWVPGGRAPFFQAVRKKLGEIQIIAEDLGIVTPEVTALREASGFPGMRVLQFAFGDDDGARMYLPHRYPKNCVAYTGTHDNDTTAGWYRAREADGGLHHERNRIQRYLGGPPRDVPWDFIRLVWASPADTVLVPLQDVLGLGSDARMNLPGVADGSWGWRFWDGALTDESARRLRELTWLYDRSPGESVRA